MSEVGVDSREYLQLKKDAQLALGLAREAEARSNDVARTVDQVKAIGKNLEDERSRMRIDMGLIREERQGYGEMSRQFKLMQERSTAPEVAQAVELFRKLVNENLPGLRKQLDVRIERFETGVIVANSHRCEKLEQAVAKLEKMQHADASRIAELEEAANADPDESDSMREILSDTQDFLADLMGRKPLFKTLPAPTRAFAAALAERISAELGSDA